MEWKNGKLQLPQVTLAAMTSVNVRQTVKAMEYSMKGIDFGDCVLITHRKPLFLPKTIRYAHTSKLTDINCFNYKMLYELGDYLHTDFVMIVHADGFVVHPEQWRDEFLDYDYIGSPWPLPKDDFSYRDIHGNLCRVGNSVGIRSRRLVNFPREANLPFEADHGYFNEDGFLCVDALCPFKELMLRTLINKCINEFVQKVCAKDVWDTDLVRFGFERQGDVFVSSFETLRLPHDCGGHA